MHWVSARTAATAATARACAANFWNPHASKRCRVIRCSWFKTVATADVLCFARSTARGTASTTATPNADSAFERDTANSTGMVLDTAWSVAPTIAAAAGDGWRWGGPAAISAGFMYRFEPRDFIIPAGTGLAIITPVATILQPADVTFDFLD